MPASISNNNSFEKYVCYSIFLLTLASFFIGFELRENSAGGGLIDLTHEWHNHLLLKNNMLGFLYENYEASRFPFFHILNLKINPFINSKSDFINSFFIYSFILIILFYYSLKTIIKENKNHIILLITSILILSPYFRTSSFWGLQENLAYIFLLSTLIINEKFNNNKLLILLFAFLSFYSDQKFIFVPAIFFFLSINKEKIFSYFNVKILIYCILLFLPTLIIFISWGGITKNETTSGINEIAFSPQNILFSLCIISLYLFPFLFLNYKKNIFKIFFYKKNLYYLILFIIIYFFLRVLFIDINLPVSGGWTFKIYKSLINLNIWIAEIIFFTLCLCSFFIVFSYYTIIKSNFLSKMILLFLIFYVLSIEIVFQEYYDPLMLFLAIFFLHKEDIANINFNKTLSLYLYFLAFWVGSISYYYFYI